MAPTHVDKVVASPAQAVADVAPGNSIAVGFGLCELPSGRLAALLEDTVVLEAATTELDDVVRLEDR